MKVICVDNYEGVVSLIIGKEYEVEYYIPGYYSIKTENSRYTITYPKYCFITLDEYRNKRLKELGI